MNERTMNDAWSSLAFRGILGILFGFAAVFWPGITLVTIVYLFGGFILASGLVNLISSLTNISNPRNSFLTKILAVVLGIIEIGVGIYLLRHPFVSFATLILLIGFTLLLIGVIDIVTGLFEGHGAMRKTLMIIGGLLTGIAGAVLLFQPVASGVAFVWILGVYALITGPLYIALALDIKNNSTFEPVVNNLPSKRPGRKGTIVA